MKLLQTLFRFVILAIIGSIVGVILFSLGFVGLIGLVFLNIPLFELKSRQNKCRLATILGAAYCWGLFRFLIHIAQTPVTSYDSANIRVFLAFTLIAVASFYFLVAYRTMHQWVSSQCSDEVAAMESDQFPDNPYQPPKSL
jgi:hypothetical protein